MSRQSSARAAAAARFVPFPDTPDLPHDQRRAALNAWVKRQMAIGREAFGRVGWRERRDWFVWRLVNHARTRLAADGLGVVGWPCEIDLREFGMSAVQDRGIAS
jgi:hypothetical protein